MIPLVKLTLEIICINHFVKYLIHDGNYAAVINLEHAFDFTTVRIHHGNIGKLDRIPAAYIVNLEDIDIKKFLRLRSILGFRDDTKYIFLGEHITSLMGPDVTPEFISNSIFINVKNGDIHTNISREPRGFQLKSINVIKSANYYGNLTNVDNSTKVFKLKNATELKICLYHQSPYCMCTTNQYCQDKGIDIELWQLILGMLNVTAEYFLQRIPTEGFKEAQHDFLYNGTCDIHSGDHSSADTVDISVPFYFDSIHWIVEAPRPQRWKYFFEIFSLNIWIIWIVSSVCLSITLYLTKKTTHESGKISDGLYVICKHMLEQAQVLEPSTWSQLVSLFTILMSTFLMNLFYDSKFTFLLTGFKDSFSMTSTEDIMDNNFNIISSEGAYFLFAEDERVSSYLRDHLEQGIFSLDVIRENVAILYLKRTFLYEIKNYLDDDRRPKFRIVEEEILTQAYCHILRRGDPLMTLVNQKIVLLMEHGFAARIISKYQTFNFQEESHDTPKKLTLNYFQLPNALWLIGMILSLAAFFYEVKK